MAKHKRQLSEDLQALVHAHDDIWKLEFEEAKERSKRHWLEEAIIRKNKRARMQDAREIVDRMALKNEHNPKREGDQ